MKDFQKEFTILELESKILPLIPNKDDRGLLTLAYSKDEEKGKYILKDKLKDDFQNKLSAIFDSIGFIPESKRKLLSANFKKIEEYFVRKSEYFERYKLIPIEEIINNSPKYYALIRIFEQINIFLSKDKEWLKKFVIKNNMNFDWINYEKWKSGKDLESVAYDDTLSPAKWVHLIQDKLIEFVETLQILLYMEYYIDDDGFKKYLRQNPGVDYKYKANYVKPSPPSEDIDKLFEIIDYLLNINIENSFITKTVIETTLCLQVYRYIDHSRIFELIKRKDFFIKFRLEYLKKTPQSARIMLPLENDIIKIGDNFLELVKDLAFSYTEYKKRLITKYEKIKSKLKLK